MPTLADRVQEIMSEFNLSSKDFAEKVGVQRSSISHIISGRNKPSLDFIMKLTTAFPQLNSKWLLHGKEGMIKDKETTEKEESTPSGLQPSPLVTNVTEEDVPGENDPQPETLEKPALEDRKKEKKEAEDSAGRASISKAAQAEAKKVSKVILVYSDGSFEILNPN